MYIPRIQNPTTIEDKAHNVYKDLIHDIEKTYSEMDSGAFYARRQASVQLYAEIEREVTEFRKQEQQFEWESEQSLRDAENGVYYERQIDQWATLRGQE